MANDYRLYLFDGATQKYVFRFDTDQPVPEIEPSLEPIYDLAPTGFVDGRAVSAAVNESNKLRLTAYRRTWKLNGAIFDLDAEDLWAEFDTLTELLMSESASFNNASRWKWELRIWDGATETTVATLDGAESVNGLTHSKFQVTNTPGRWATNFEFEIEVSGVFYPTGKEVPMDLKREYEVITEGTKSTQRWTITAKGPGAKEYILSLDNLADISGFEAQSDPWQELIDLGHDNLPNPSEKSVSDRFTKKSYKESFDDQSWTAIFEIGGSTGGGGGSYKADVFSNITEVNVSGGFRPVGALEVMHGRPYMYRKNMEAAMITVSHKARCRTKDAAQDVVTAWEKDFPLDSWDGGGLAGIDRSGPTPEEENNDPTKAIGWTVTQTKSYAFNSLEEIPASIVNFFGGLPNFKWAEKDTL